MVRRLSCQGWKSSLVGMMLKGASSVLCIAKRGVGRRKAVVDLNDTLPQSTWQYIILHVMLLIAESPASEVLAYRDCLAIVSPGLYNL